VLPIIHCCSVSSGFGGYGKSTHLAERSEEHQKPAEEEVGASPRCTIVTSASPAHESPAEGGEREEEADEGTDRSADGQSW
jgi:hypothetical protein